MNISIQKELLEKNLSLITSIVEKRQTLPILSHVMITLKKGKMTLVGSDLQTELTTQIHDVTGADCQTSVSARKLYDICKSLPNESQLEMAIEKNQLTVISGKSKFILKTLNCDEYPYLEQTSWNHEFTLEYKQLKQLLVATAFSMAQQDVRYYLNGLLLEIEQNMISSVATDGHRLAVTSLKFLHSEIPSVQVIIPKKAVYEISKFIHEQEIIDVHLKINNHHISISSGDITFITKLIDGKFPDYRKVIPANLNKSVTVDRKRFIDILNRVAILSNKQFPGVTLTFENSVLKMGAHNAEQEKAYDEMPINYNDESHTIGFNVHYLLDVLKSCTEQEMEIRFFDNTTSCVLKAVESEENTTFIIMPMRI